MNALKSERDYDLRIKDRTLARIRIEDGAFESAASAVWADAENAHLMPFGLQLTNEGIWRWLKDRALPYKRRFSEAICRSLGFDVNDTEAIYRAGLGLSLNDCYWLPPHRSALRFEDVTPYENEFSEALAQVALDGSSDAPGHGLTPELTTDGTLPKAWRIEADGTRVLYKGATPGYRPGEPVSEALASSIADAMGIDHAHYSLRVLGGQTYSVCANFTTTEVSYVPYAVAAGGHRKLSDALAYAWLIGDEQLEKLCDMLAFDCVICNNDRHFANFGFMRDNGKGKIVGMAPVFDNGRGLFPSASDATAEDLEQEARLTRPSFGGSSFEELCSRVMGARQRDALATLGREGFQVPDGIGERGEQVREFAMKRAQGLSNLPMADQVEFMKAVRHHAEELTGCRQGAWQPKAEHCPKVTPEREREIPCPEERRKRRTG